MDQWLAMVRSALGSRRPGFRFREQAVFALDSFAHLRVASGDLRWQGSHLFPEQHPDHGQGTCTMDAILGGSGLPANRDRVPQGAR